MLKLKPFWISLKPCLKQMWITQLAIQLPNVYTNCKLQQIKQNPNTVAVDGTTQIPEIWGW